MTKNRKMVRVLDTQLFEQNKETILKFEKRLGEFGGGNSARMSDSKALSVMVRTCASLWGDGEDLHLSSEKRTLGMVAHLVVTATDENISQAVKCLAEWLGLRITYTREGSNFTFRYEKPGFGVKELVLPMRRPEPPNQYPVN